MTREQGPRRHKKDRPGRQVSLEQQLARSLRLHAEATAQQYAVIEREKVLCDQVLHQQFFKELLATVGEPSGPDTDSQQQHPTQQHQHVPRSYVARLLQLDVSKQLQQVLKMTAQDWLRFFADIIPKLAFLLELCQRSEQQGGVTAAPCAGQPKSSAHEPLQDPQDLRRAPLGNGTRGGDVAMTAPCCWSNPADSSILAQWFGAQPPLGQSSSADYQQLQEAVDYIATHVMLAYVFNHLPLLEACAFSFSPGPQVRPTAQHWEKVADRLQLTELQQQHWTVCLAEYRRLSQTSRADGGALLQEAATPSLLVAAAELQEEQQRQQQQSSGGKQQQGQAAAVSQEGRGASGRSGSRGARRSSRCGAQNSSACGSEEQQPLDAPAGLDRGQRPSNTADGKAGSSLLQQQDDGEEGTALDELGHKGQDRLQLGLQQYVQRRHVHLLSTATFFINSLSQWQLALLISHSYPWMPSFTAAAEAVTKRWQAKQERHVQRIQLQAVQQQGFSSPPGSRAESPAAVVPGTSGGSGQGGVGGLGGEAAEGLLAAEIKQHEQRRVAELELHRQLCWAQVNDVQEQQQQLAIEH